MRGVKNSEITKAKHHLRITSRVKINPRFFRPTEVDQLLGDPSKARSKLGWKPKVDFESLVKDMMESDLALMAKDPLA